jgi:hypothetical protein
MVLWTSRAELCSIDKLPAFCSLSNCEKPTPGFDRWLCVRNPEEVDYVWGIRIDASED